MPPRHYRQGDVLVIEAGLIPPDAVVCDAESGRWVLAHGELSGHAHAISLDGVTMRRTETECFLDVKRPTRILHEEHAPVDLPPGVYRVVRQREYVPPRSLRRDVEEPEIRLPGTTRYVPD